MAIPLQYGLIQYIALLFALVIHESAHALSAHWMGDDTAKNLGRISMNPIVHMDIIGTVVFPLIMIFSGGAIPLFGWAKPVPVNPLNFDNRRKGVSLVSFAGPLSNVALGTIFLVLFLVLRNVSGASQVMVPVLYLLMYSVFINFILAFFNMIPVPPLDGSGVLFGLIKEKTYLKYIEPIAPFGFIILLVLLYTGVLGLMMSPVLNILRIVMGV